MRTIRRYAVLLLAQLWLVTSVEAQRAVTTITPTAPDLRITEASSGFAFALIANIGRPALAMENGDLIILDRSTQQLVVFNRAGQRVRVAGGVGLEPGKTLGIGGIGQIGDTIWVREAQPPHRFNLFRSDLTFIHTVAPRNGDMNPQGLLANNMATMLMPGSRPPNASPTVPRYLGIAVASLDGTAPRPMVWLKAPTVPNSLRFGRVNVPTPAPLQEGALFALSPEADRIVIVERFISVSGERSSYKVTTIRPSGDTLWHRSIAYTPQPVQPATLDVLRAEARGVEDSVLRSLPRFVSPVADFLVGSGGIVWVAERSSQPYQNEWLLFDASGVEQVRVRLDFGHRAIAARGNDLWTVTTDITGTTSLNRFTVRVPR